MDFEEKLELQKIKFANTIDESKKNSDFYKIPSGKNIAYEFSKYGYIVGEENAVYALCSLVSNNDFLVSLDEDGYIGYDESQWLHGYDIENVVCHCFYSGSMSSFLPIYIYEKTNGMHLFLNRYFESIMGDINFKDYKLFNKNARQDGMMIIDF